MAWCSALGAALSVATVATPASAAEQATVIVVQDATPGDDIDFKFGGNLGPFVLDDPASDDGDATTNSRTFQVDAGTVRVRQQVFSRWQLTAIDCTPTTNAPTTDLDKGLVIMAVEAGETITCTFRNTDSRLDMGNINVRIGKDLDGDGQYDAGEPWISDRTVSLFDSDNTPAGEQVTDGDGRVGFDVMPGDYTVCTEPPTGWISTKPATGEPCRDVTVGPAATTWLRFFQQGGDTSADHISRNPSISADGTRVVYFSRASNLVPGDTEGRFDIFLYDTVDETTTRISVDPAGLGGNSDSTNPKISADGDRIVYSSLASNLVAGDTNNRYDIFLYDIPTATTTRLSVDDAGNQSIGTSAVGSISADGTRIVFNSNASDLLPDTAGDFFNVYLHDTTTNTTTLITRDRSGEGSANESSYPLSTSGISGDGTRIVFASKASNLVEGDSNRTQDVFMYDTTTATTTKINGGEPDGRPSGEPAISTDGTKIAFSSSSRNVIPGSITSVRSIFLYDVATGTTVLVSANAAGEPGIVGSERPAISADGTRISFASFASNLVPDDTGRVDIFVYDTTTGAPTRINMTANGGEANRDSLESALSADGTRIVYTSKATNLVAPDTNGWQDVFLFDATTETTIRVSSAPG